MVVRVGSYPDKAAAEAKRAELMLNGVQTQVVTYTNKSGKEVHLLQTSPLAEDQAKVIHQRLQLRNFNSQLRNAS
jgi:cell division protein FtsN